ncbi:cytokine-inducible SH2-containing protein-like [Xyrauchen texanus]|uniref:cytokine-inducible SH2-containing protein-like n=1 Tax=Xyrauchen texanus TaxID=154827 RepID=UPI0022423130|nr:cytokine-inducible SH2-containing protein-like [Xyrauchen texanus]
MILCVQGPRAHLADTPDPMVRFPVVTFPSPRCIHATVTIWEPSKDLRAITNNFSYLDATGWYWGAISASEAHSVLQGASEGTFLVRDSSHPLYMLTLSVKTCRGPTNVRIEYSLGRFRLDSSSPTRSRLQSFPDVPSLVQHYVGSRTEEQWEKNESNPVASSTPKECAVLLKLKRPINCPQAFPSLQHLSRLVINRHATCTESLPLPRPLHQYLQDYPFQL